MSLMRKYFSLWIISLFMCNVALSDVIVSIDDVLVGGYTAVSYTHLTLPTNREV